MLSRVHWVKPQHVCEVRFTWTADGLLRHVVFEGLRRDSSAEGVRPHTGLASPLSCTAPTWLPRFHDHLGAFALLPLGCAHHRARPPSGCGIEGRQHQTSGRTLHRIVPVVILGRSTNTERRSPFPPFHAVPLIAFSDLGSMPQSTTSLEPAARRHRCVWYATAAMSGSRNNEDATTLRCSSACSSSWLTRRLCLCAWR